MSQDLTNAFPAPFAFKDCEPVLQGDPEGGAGSVRGPSGVPKPYGPSAVTLGGGGTPWYVDRDQLQIAYSIAYAY